MIVGVLNAFMQIDQMEEPYDQKQIVEEGSRKVGDIGELLDSLDECHRFFARRQDSYLACFLVGRLKIGQGGWCGLVSIGVAS